MLGWLLNPVPVCSHGQGRDISQLGRAPGRFPEGLRQGECSCFNLSVSKKLHTENSGSSFKSSTLWYADLSILAIYLMLIPTEDNGKVGKFLERVQPAFVLLQIPSKSSRNLLVIRSSITPLCLAGFLPSLIPQGKFLRKKTPKYWCINKNMGKPL